MKVKKILSAVLATAMLSTCFSASGFAQEESNVISGFSADELTVNATHNGFVTLPNGTGYGVNNWQNTNYGNAKAYKLENVFGLGEDEYGIELIAREQRADQPYLMVNIPNEELESMKKEDGKYEDFYISSNIYIGGLRSSDYFRLSGEWNDNGARQTGNYLFFNGEGRVVKSNNIEKNGAWGSRYLTDNWYNVTLAYVDGMIKIYVDGKTMNNTRYSYNGDLMNDYTVKGDLTNLQLGIRMESGITDVNGDPSWAVVKDIKAYKGTYSNASSDTTVTSDTYTVKAWSFNPRYLETVDADFKRLTESYVSGADTSVTAGTFLNNIIVPTGAEKSVVKINPDDSKTIAVGADEKLADGMRLLIKTIDGSMKFYDIKVETAASDLPEISLKTDAPARYTLDAATNTFNVPDTTVGKLLGYINAGTGTTAKVTNNDGSITRADNDPVTDTMKVVAEKNGNKVEYAVKVSKNTSVITLGDNLAKLANDTIIFEADLSAKGNINTPTTNMSGNNGLFGMDAGNIPSLLGKPVAHNYKVYKTTIGNDAGYKMVRTSQYTVDEMGYVNHQSAQNKQNASNALNGEKMIINLKAIIPEGAEVVMIPYYLGGGGSGGYAAHYIRLNNTQAIVSTGHDSAGGWSGTGVYGTYEATNNPIDVSIVINSNRTSSDDGKSIVTIDAIYVNGTKINNKAISHTYSGTLSNAMRQIGFETKGNVSIAGLKVYMADDYNPNKANFVDTESEVDAPEKVTDFGVEIKAPLTADTASRVFGWSGKTAAEVKNLIDSSINTQVRIFDATGTKEVKDNAAVENNMIVKIQDVNYADNAVTYVLALANDWGTWNSSSDETKVTLSRDIKMYQVDGTEKNVSVFFAAYKGNKLLQVRMQSATIKKDGVYNFNAELNKVDGAEYKAMIWDNTNNKPYEAVNPVTAE